MVLYRVYPTSHQFLANIFKAACITTFIGTISETIVIMYMFGILWNQWSLSFKIMTPVLHLAFAAGQLHGTRNLYAIWKKQEGKLKQVTDSQSEKKIP